ncbi:hypothetical protein P3T18_003735 [Paraburkholderia sp. GAS199]|uniref:hypothetical protein n=1 Tax=Paraburkholderia sp. GAS199 TaxID=3035126 RepID=UPI003D1F6F76
MKRTLKRTGVATLMAAIALGASGWVASAAHAQTAHQTQDAAASMVKPPEAASGATGSSNPDNMPIKRPAKPTNDRMMHPPPASGANAK